MNWPPVKAWTNKKSINGQKHFVAINYGGRIIKRWVILMSVIDSTVVVEVSKSELDDQSIWSCGWDENDYLDSPDLINSKYKIITTKGNHPSLDSGLTIPITKNIIRPWFVNN